MINEYDSVTALAAALKIISGNVEEYAPIQLTAEAPVVFREKNVPRKRKPYPENRGPNKPRRKPPASGKQRNFKN